MRRALAAWGERVALIDELAAIGDRKEAVCNDIRETVKKLEALMRIFGDLEVEHKSRTLLNGLRQGDSWEWVLRCEHREVLCARVRKRCVPHAHHAHACVASPRSCSRLTREQSQETRLQPAHSALRLVANRLSHPRCHA